MRLFDKLYRVLDKMDVSDKFFNTRFKSIDDRLHAVEELKGTWEAETDRLSKIAIDQITELLAETANVSLGFASLGAILSVKSLSTFAVEAGVVTLIVNEADRSKVPDAAFIAAVPLGFNGVSLSGIMTAWNADTGELSFQGSSVIGSGTYSEWVVGLSAPNTNYDPNSVPDATKAYVDNALADLEALSIAGL